MICVLQFLKLQNIVFGKNGTEERGIIQVTSV